MNSVYQILGLLAAGLILFILYRSIKNRPEQFAKENLTKSLFTMGVLALLLIGFIAVMVLILNS